MEDWRRKYVSLALDPRNPAGLAGKGAHALYHCPTFRRTIVQSTFETQWYPVPSGYLPTAASIKHIVLHFVKSLTLLRGLHLFGRKSLHLCPYLWPSSPAILLASRLYSTVIAGVATPILILARRKLGCRDASIVASRRPIYHKRLIAIP